MTLKLELGQTFITPGASSAISSQEVMAAMKRHQAGDWGNVCEEDLHQNNWAVENNARVISSYESASGTRFWIITEADRSATTVLLPEEY